MSKFAPLWDHVRAQNKDALMLTFDEIGRIAGVPIDHSFLNFKKELIAYGYQVEKISLKSQTVLFSRVISQQD